MPFLLFARKAVFCFFWGLFLAISTTVIGQTNYYGAYGTEYAVVGALPGDQTWPDVAISTNGGFAVWQDNATDGDGWGVSARRLDGTLSGTLSTFRVNQSGAGNQQNPRVAMLKNGGAVIVWQGGQPSYQHIYAQILTPANTFLTTTDIVVNTFTNNFQINPAVAVLNNSNIVVVWASFDQVNANSLQDVYGQILLPSGQKSGGEFLINQFTNFNQRTPTVAALQNGGFAVAWVSEQQRTVVGSNMDTNGYATAASIATPSVDIYARIYNSNAVATSSEFLVNSNFNPCANPAMAATTTGITSGFMVTWGARDMASFNYNSLDVFARSFNGSGVGGSILRINSNLYGDQYGPRVSAIGLEYLVTWTSMAQDGAREGVFGQFVHNNGALIGNEFRVNTTTAGQQMEAAVASDRGNQFLVVWTGFTATPNGFDLYAQRYANVSAALPAMAAPFVWAPFVFSNNVYQPQLQVSWPMLLGVSISNYEVYVNGTNAPMAIVSSLTNQWTMTAANGLTASSSNSFRMDYVTTDNRRSAISAATSGVTWSGKSWGGIPYEWMTNYFGSNTNLWPAATADGDHDGVNNLKEFLAGTAPTNATSVLTMQMANTPQGVFLSWNTQPGLTYQLQVTTNLTSWSNWGAARFAAGTNDSIYVGGGSAGYYRVQLLR